MLIEYEAKWQDINSKYDLKKDVNVQRFIVQNPKEWNDFMDIVSNFNVGFGLEIGTYSGGSFYALCQVANPNAILISIDKGGGAYRSYEQRVEVFENEFKQPNQKLHVLNMNSTHKETIDEVEEILGSNELDYLFIDGRHNYPSVSSDYDNYERFVRLGGIIAFHDIVRKGGVARKWNEIKNDHESIEIFHYDEIEDADIGCYGIGVIYK